MKLYREEDQKIAAESEFRLLPLSEQLQQAAKNERDKAKQFEGCSFMGEWPGTYHLRQASMLESAALIVLKHEKTHG